MFDVSLFGPHIRLKHLVPFLHQAGTMLRAGLDLRQALRTLARVSPSRTLRQVVARMCERVEAGQSMEAALQAAGTVFPDMMVRVLSVGEVSGSLGEMFLELANYYDWWRLVLRRLLTGLIYPGFMLFVLWHVLALLMAFGVVSVLGMGYQTFLLIFYIGVPVVLFLPKFLRRVFGRTVLLDTLLLGLPVVGKQIRTLLLARFCLALQLMLGAGVKIDEALARAAEATGNAALARGVRPAVEEVLEGEALATALAHTGMFPETFLARMQTAEESGAVAEDLRRLADQYADEARFAVDLIMRGLAFGAYVLMAAIVIYFIFRLWGQYAGAISSLAGG
jgi:type II secretory pathway component PulF